jgi:Uma2 family endonuclease
MAIVQTGLTLDEFLRLPEEKPALEYVDGVVTQKMAPSGPHGELQAELAFQIKLFLKRLPIARVYTELRNNRVRRSSLVPDLSVYMLDRIPTNPDGKVADEFWVPPDLAIEIASPGQSANWLAGRADLLLSAGVRVVIVVEPRQERVRLARPDQPTVTYQGDDVLTIDDVLPGFQLAVRALFAELEVRRPGSGPAR